MFNEQLSGCRVLDCTLRRFVGYGLKRAFNTIQTDLNNTLRPFDLRLISFSALAVINDNPGLNQSRLAEVLAIERPNLVQVVDTLEQRDLILRNRDADDRRSNVLHLTGAGQTLLEEALSAVQAHERRVTADIGPDERKALLDALRRIEQANAGEYG